MTFASPFFGPLYVMAFVAALASIVFRGTLGTRIATILATCSLVVAGYSAGLALRSTSEDVSGDAFTLAPVTLHARVPDRLGPATGIDHEIGVDVFAAARAAQGVSPAIALHGDDGVAIVGWAFDPSEHARCSAVVAVVQGRTTNGRYGLDRPDVGAAFGADHRYTGYSIVVPASAIGRGRHTLELRCLGAAGRSYAGPTTFQVEVGP